MILLQNVIKFWLDKGVDGFRVDAVRHIYEAAELNKHERPSGLKGYSKAIFLRLINNEKIKGITFILMTLE